MVDYVGRQPIIFRAPSSTLDAKIQADLAATYAAQAAISAQASAAAAAGRIYPDYATGNAATTTGQYFFVGAAGAYDLYVHGTGTPVTKLPTLEIATGNLGVGTGTPSNTLGFDKQVQIEGAFPCLTLFGTTGNGKFSIGINGDGNLIIWDNIANATAMLLGKNGNLGIGPFTGAPGVRLNPSGTGELFRKTTTTARGSGDCFSTWYDPTGVKGYFGYASGATDQFYLLNALNTAMLFGTNNVDRWQITATGHWEPVLDNSKDAGSASARIKTIHLVNSPSVTSDEREKDWRGAPSEAELRAAKRIAAELGFYQWKVEPDGPLRFGAKAQAVRDILEDEGLLDGNPARYGLIDHHEWTDGETDEPRDRYSICTDQLALFLIAAQEVRLLALEAAL